MIEYTMTEHLNVSANGSEASKTLESSKTVPLKHIQGNKDQHVKSADALLERKDANGISAPNVQEAFRALTQAMLHRQELTQLSEETIRIYTDLLRLDGICIYKSSAEGILEVLACNTMWSNLFSTLEAEDEVESHHFLLNPAVFLKYPFDVNGWEKTQPSKVMPVTIGMRQYGSILSLPLVSDGTMVGAVSLFSMYPQFFIPERIEILQLTAGITASLYRMVWLQQTLEKEQMEKVDLQQDIHALRGRQKQDQQVAGRGVDADAAYDELEALSYSVSHDLRAPIIVIQNSCEWLTLQYAGQLDAEGNALLHQIAASSDHMKKLLDGLLAFSRVVQFRPQKSTIDMTSLVRSVIDDVIKNENDSSSLSIAVQPLIPAQGDAVLIRQVWQNLLSNALKYTRYKQKREVVIESQLMNGGVKYCVSDNGIGFDMKYADRLFGAFQRLHVAEEFEGTGVGLAIVQRIVRRHGGQVWAEGKVDYGARFFFTLPSA
jgi:signal transduction histidine kinase